MNIKILPVLLPIAFVSSLCTDNRIKEEVVIYTSVNQVFSSQVLKEFGKESGIHVKAVYGTEGLMAACFGCSYFTVTKKGIKS